jgi:hypothetical protein
MSKLADSPAFSCETIDPADQFTDRPVRHSGMTLRQFTAIHALQGLAANYEATSAYSTEVLAEMAVNYADALLLALEKPTV